MSKKHVEVRWNKKTRFWRVWSNGEIQAGDPIKAIAVKAGRYYAKLHSRELVVKNKDGKIAFRNSYGGDSPRNSIGLRTEKRDT
jgi:hypothetical protein